MSSDTGTEKSENRNGIRGGLLEEALRLPLTPGVYLMKDAGGRIIYVGKSRHLRDRVSQYFRDGKKNGKTERMVSSVRSFECMVCDSEIEALTLENTLIKRYSPKFNIKLKDCKSYPYIKLTAGEYPVPAVTRKRLNDGGSYYGPFSGTSAAYSLLSVVCRTFGLPSCRRKFPDDIGRGRPCIYYQMGRCCGLCTGNVDSSDYAERVKSAGAMLRGGIGEVRKTAERKMYEYAEAERYEAAAVCRDTLRALDSLVERQKTVASPDISRDVAATGEKSGLSALSVLRIRGGALTDAVDYIIDSSVPDIRSAAMSLLAEHYSGSTDIPPELLLGTGFCEDDAALLSDYLRGLAGENAAPGGGKKPAQIPVALPQRGEKKKLCVMAEENAALAAERESRRRGRDERVAAGLASVLALETLPSRIEAYDISNFGSEQITAGMIVTEDGAFRKRDYRVFSIKDLDGPDDYAAMKQALSRRLAYLRGEKQGDTSLCVMPDLILVDGGAGHLAVALEALSEAGLDIPCAGMVKDGNHRTRTLVTPDGECDIAGDRDLFVFIYRIQEEIHRFTVSKMTAGKRKTLRRSSLEKIDGIGPAKAAALLAAFGGLAGVRAAGEKELAGVRGMSASDAASVFAYFHGTDGPEEQEEEKRRKTK